MKKYFPLLIIVCLAKSFHTFIFPKGWLAIAKLKPLSLFISLYQHCQMLS